MKRTKRPRCLAITCGPNGLPRACGEPTHDGEHCLHHAAMFATLAPPAPPKAVQR